MALLSLPIVALATVVGCLLVLLARLRSPMAALPGPRLSLFTSAVLRYHELRGKRTAYVHEMHQKYGPAVRVAPNEAVFASLEAMKEIYLSSGSGFNKSTFYNLFSQFGLSTMFSTMHKDPHSKRRRIIADRYANSNVVREDSMHGLRERSQNFMTRVINAPNQELDIYVFLHCYAFDCATHHLFHPYGTNSIMLDSDEDIMREVTFDSSLASRLLMYYNPTLGRLINSTGIFGKARDIPLAKKLVLDAVRDGKVASFTLVSRLLDKERGVGEMDTAAECMDHMVAGIETTGDALCFLMWQISQPSFEHVQDGIRLELEQNPGVPQEQLPYLDAVIKEGLRVFPSIPMSLPRCVPDNGHQVDGYWLPRGTIVSCQPYSMHRMDNAVFPEPDAFRPERWMEEKGQAERNRLFFSFANGGRACIGRHLAMAEMRTVLCDIYSKFRTTPAQGMTADMSPDDQVFTTRPKDQKCVLKFTELQ